MVVQPLLPANRGVCFEGKDSSLLRIPAQILIQGDLPRNPESQAGRLANQFLQQNRGLLADFGVHSQVEYDGELVELVLTTSTQVGAIPLLSPTTGRPDYGLVITPRFDWLGIGSMLATMGWRVVPTPLRLPLLPGSERKIPPWVLSTVVLFRLRALLNSLDRRFELIKDDLPAPRGTVNWQFYATKQLPQAKFLQVPCQFPDLRDDRELKAAIHFTLRKQLASLNTQRHAGVLVLHLIELCLSLLEKVRPVPAKQPSTNLLLSWTTGSLRTDVFREGLQAIEWTVDDRGLAGLSDLQGLPWVLSMEQFFEAWVETAVSQLARHIGGTVKIGRKQETIVPFQWEPPYSGSQRYLLPDVILERENETIIFDAKYKRHWEELALNRWHQMDEVIQQQHRQDLLQVLAYAATKPAKKVTCCLAYPCQTQTWQSLRERGRLHHRATIPAGTKQLNLILTAVPMNHNLDQTVQELIQMILPPYSDN
jgi:hypothetical protein